ncbi:MULTISPECIES: hypothetical protein [unclassified Streptomyces]|uniref:hypothetical protein n=1 Tax=unclassified Streptomyces TaxID=2593676 RepID=UPI00109EA6A8|nr:hypothetical protein [Streptomyces sp. A1136]THA49289.1 hypothetical protein E6R62_28440 [Streptomyces sp. A1136]
MTTRATRTGGTTYATRPPTCGPGSSRPGAVGRVLQVAALAATVPYLCLKGAWLAGSRIGIPDGSVLLEPGVFFKVANAVTLVMDSAVIVLVLVLTRPWGVRVPSWLLTVPVFIATGLLVPIVVAFPAQRLMGALGLGPDAAARAAKEPFLHPWVFDVVYSGFIVQAIALTGLFVPYARRRWGRRWQGVLGERLPSPTGVVAGAAAATAVAVAAVELSWAFGGTAGLSASQIAQYDPQTGAVFATHAMCALVAGAGAVTLARGGARRARVVLAVAWAGAAAAACWGLWLLIGAWGATGPGEAVTTAMLLTYTAQMVTGLLAAAVLVRFLASRRTG